MLTAVCTRSSRSVLRALPSTPRLGSIHPRVHHYHHLRTLSSLHQLSTSTARQFGSSTMAPSDNNSNNGSKRPRESNEKDEHDQEHENSGDWKKQPPYAPEDPNKPKKAHFKGNCHCHDVTFEIYAEKPKGSHFCQCVAFLTIAWWRPDLNQKLTLADHVCPFQLRCLPEATWQCDSL